jgi:hypothetical protein
MMLRCSLMAAALTTVVLVSGRSSARGVDDHAEHMMKCAKVCAECQVDCDSCFKHCLTLLADGKKEHAQTAQLRRELQDVLHPVRPAKSPHNARRGVLRQVLR